MQKSLAIAMFAAAVVAAGMAPDAAFAHHNVYHNLGKCGSAVCPGPKQTRQTETEQSER
jgi:glycerate-2-kinase